MTHGKPGTQLAAEVAGDQGSRLPAERGRWHHLLILAAAGLVPLLGATMSLEREGGVSLPGLGGTPLPTLCWSRRLGFECPSCGMTRSIIALMHGNWQVSLRFHRFGWLVALFIVSQIPYRILRLVRPHGRWPLVEAAGWTVFLALAALMAGDWLIGLLTAAT